MGVNNIRGRHHPHRKGRKPFHLFNRQTCRLFAPQVHRMDFCVTV